jgi:TRAP-type transport system small permease protein
MADRLFTLLDRVVDLVLVLLTIVMVAVVIVQVICRYVFNAPIMGAEDLAKLCMVWIVFLAAGRVTRDDQHIRIDFFMDRVPARARSVADGCTAVLSIGLVLVILVSGLALLSSQHGMKSVGLNIDVTYFSGALPVGMALWILHAVRRQLRPAPRAIVEPPPAAAARGVSDG